ncbi:MAG: tetratricopeptide repeat protein [Candidatus Cloacimonetes bacterium]|nr:tetratricopeptide repeat protein [Candidatus Cloacimonadota bacterium]
MRRSLLCMLLLILTVMLIATPVDDMKFAVGLYTDGNYKLAEIELRNFISNNPESNLLADAKFLLANVLLVEKNYDQALKLFDELYSSDPNPAIRAEVLMGLGQCNFFENDLSESEKYLQDFVKIFPRHLLRWKADYFLGRINLKREKLDEALRFLDKAAAINDDISIKIARLEVFIAHDQTPKADEVMQTLLAERNEQRNRALLIYQNFNLRKKNYDKILNVGFDSIPITSEYYQEYSLLLRRAYYYKGEYKEALKRLEPLTSEKASYFKALCLYETDSSEEAGKILAELVRSVDKEISSNSFFYLAKMEPDKQKSISMLKEFVKDNPSHLFTPSAYYQIGYNYFLLGEFAGTLDNFDIARSRAHQSADPQSHEIYKNFQEQISYLASEADFLMGNEQKASEKYKEYIGEYPKGEFLDEALFKLGLLHFRGKDYTEALSKFDMVLENHPYSDKTGMSNYYIGEINFFQSSYNTALKYYVQALEGKSDAGYTWERIARIYLEQGKFDDALSSLENIPELPKYAFDKLLLKGNIYFATREYDKALKTFSFAEDKSNNSQETELAVSRQAWTLYQLKRFDQASQLYSKLSGTTSSPEKYIFKAATAAFSAEDYLRAIDFFRQYENSFSSGENYHVVLLGIADSYYNLGDYVQAADYYGKLLTPTSDDKLLNNALNGLRWSAEQNEIVDFLGILDDLLEQSNEKDFRVRLLDRKIYFEYKKEQWQDVISTCKELEILSPGYQKINELKLLKALSFVELKQFDKAEEVYSELQSTKNAPEVLLNWAKLHLLKGDKPAAVKKLRKASMISRRTELWLLLLELELELEDRLFSNDFAKYTEFAEGENKQLAELLYMEWQINQADYDSGKDKLNELLKSKFKTVKAKAQFIKGYALFKQEQYDKAIPELLRVRYLYPEMVKTRNKAEFYACIGYIHSNRMEEAKQLYETIAKDISSEERQKIESMLEEGAEQ